MSHDSLHGSRCTGVMVHARHPCRLPVPPTNDHLLLTHVLPSHHPRTCTKAHVVMAHRTQTWSRRAVRTRDHGASYAHVAMAHAHRTHTNRLMAADSWYPQQHQGVQSGVHGPP